MCTFKILMHINTYLCIVLHISRAFETKYAKICKYMTKCNANKNAKYAEKSKICDSASPVAGPLIDGQGRNHSAAQA